MGRIICTMQFVFVQLLQHICDIKENKVQFMRLSVFYEPLYFQLN